MKNRAMKKWLALLLTTAMVSGTFASVVPAAELLTDGGSPEESVEWNAGFAGEDLTGDILGDTAAGETWDEAAFQEEAVPEQTEAPALTETVEADPEEAGNVSGDLLPEEEEELVLDSGEADPDGADGPSDLLLEEEEEETSEAALLTEEEVNEEEEALEEQAQEVEASPAENFTYTLSGDEVTITGYKGSEEAVVVPDTIDGHPVTKIGSNAFNKDNTKTVKKLTLSEGIISISAASFNGCEALEELSFPASLVVNQADSNQEEGKTAFPMECPAITRLKVAAGNTTIKEINGAVYSTDKKMLYYYPTGRKQTTFTAVAGVKRICNYAFSKNEVLEEVILPDTVEEIGFRAFAFCSALKTMKSGYSDEEHVHDMTAVTEVPATCDTPGQKAHYKCEGCGMLFEDEAGTRTLSDSDLVIPALGHDYQEKIEKATFEKDGKISRICSRCQDEIDVEVILHPVTVKLSETEAEYDGNEHKPQVILLDGSGNDFPESMYRVDMPASMINAGAYTITVILQGNAEGTRNLTYTIKSSGTAPDLEFDDVTDSGKFYFTPVYWAVMMGITTGYKDTATGLPTGIFGVNDLCTREQIVTFLWRMQGSPAPRTRANFIDVKKGYYVDAISWALENNITTGVSATTFGVGQDCSRAMCVTFLYRTAGNPDVSDGSAFTDVPEGKWFTKAVSWAAQNGITTGYKDSHGNPTGKFGLNDPCKRSEIVTFLYRFANLA